MSAVGQVLTRLLGIVATLFVAAGVIGLASLAFAAFRAGNASRLLGDRLPSGVLVSWVYAALILGGVILKALTATSAGNTPDQATGGIVAAVLCTVVVLALYIGVHQVLGGAPIRALMPTFAGLTSARCAAHVSVEPLQARPGENLAVAGHCYPGRAPIAVFVDDHKLSGSDKADADGNVTLRFTLTAGSQRAFPGMHSVSVRTGDGTQQASATFRVVEP